LGQSQPPLENRAYSREEISKILEYTDERSRAIILILTSSGCRINALPKLIRDDLKMVEEYQLYQIRLYSDSNESYYSYLTPEATKALNSYLSFRTTTGEKIHPKSPVIRKEFHRETAVHNPKPLTSRGFEEIINDLLIRSGPRKVQHTGESGRTRHQIKLSSGFRKFFNTQLEAANVRVLIKERLMGHSVGLDKSYLKPTENEVLQEYLKAVNHLTISDENRLKLEVKALETERDKEIHDLKKQIEELSKEDDEEIKALRQEFLNLKEAIRKKAEEPEIKRLTKGVSKDILRKTKR
jgi:integrase